jgi:pilus assembly protein CpaB
MNVTRIAVLFVAAIAAIGAALMARGMMGGGEANEAAETPQIEIVQVLVATDRIEPGRSLTVDMVRWEEWPSTSVTDELVTEEANPDLTVFLEGAVARAPLLAGEPVTEAKLVRTGNGTFLSATLAPGKRAVAVPVSAESTAGGLVLPNDRVDVILTLELEGEDGTTNYSSDTLLRDIRLLAIDQTFTKDDGTTFFVGSTATLELTPMQTEMVAQAESMGTLSLALRSLGDEELAEDAGAFVSGAVNVVRFGVTRMGEAGVGGAAQ